MIWTPPQLRETKFAHIDNGKCLANIRIDEGRFREHCACEKNGAAKHMLNTMLSAAAERRDAFSETVFKENIHLFVRHETMVVTFHGHSDGAGGVCFEYEARERFCDGQREWVYAACHQHQALVCAWLTDFWPLKVL